MDAWARLWWDGWRMGAEAQGVVALRLMKLAAGGAAAQVEAQRMVTEKVEAAAAANVALALGLMTGAPLGGARKAQALVRRKVRANRRRLAK